mmetsp:Transcript_29292/g.73480  ORF Transcript_29292/g.73480 Transcript_29292/m.73480 type:complete len:740 (-) Transcript_29292:13-2232(-)
MVTIPRFGGGGPAPPPPPPLAPGGDSAGVEAGSVESPAAHYKWHSALLDFIPAVQTAPYDLRSRPHTMLAAAWNEEVTIDEDADVLLDKGVMLLFEVLQPPESMTELPKKSAHGAMRPLAWGFLKIQSEHGPLLGELKLQLYTYQKTDGTACLRSPQPQFGPRVNNSAKQAYIQWWKEEISKRRHKYPSFLQVKVDIIERKEPEVVVTTPSKGLRPTTMLGGWGGYELGRYDLLEEAGLGGLGLDVQSSMASSTSLISEDEASVTRAVLARPPGYPCQIPNALMHKLPGTPLGATALCFAHNGTLLAVAVGGTSLWGVQVWDIITGTLMTTMTGHHEMIYDISWSPDDSLIVTASSDYTAKVWDVTSLDALNPRAPIKRVPPAVLQHACFVYCAAFHPSEPHIVATGCYDNAICLWNHESPPQLLHRIKVHQACVNRLAFDPLGKRMYSADGEGFIRVWSADTRTQNVAEGLRLLKMLDELRGEAITSLRIHPNGRRLLVLTKRSRLVTFDIAKLFAMNSQYVGVKCTAMPLQAAFSPDGRYIISGSEDGRVYVWDVEHHEPHHMTHISFRGLPVYCITWSPAMQCLAACSFTPLAPVQVYYHEASLPPVAMVSRAAPFESRAGALRDKTRPSTMGPATLSARTARMVAALPDKLTPEHLADMLSSIRASVRSKGFSPSKAPLEEEILVVREGSPEARRSPLSAPRRRAAREEAARALRGEKLDFSTQAQARAQRGQDR